MITRRRDRSTALPAVLPLVEVRPHDPGTMTITLDSQPVCDTAVPVVQLGEAISQIVDQLATPVRVEVHASDGAVHADILTPPPLPSGEPSPERPRSGAPIAPPLAWASGPAAPGEAAPARVAAAATAATGGRARAPHEAYLPRELHHLAPGPAVGRVQELA